ASGPPRPAITSSRPRGRSLFQLGPVVSSSNGTRERSPNAGLGSSPATSGAGGETGGGIAASASARDRLAASAGASPSSDSSTGAATGSGSSGAGRSKSGAGTSGRRASWASKASSWAARAATSSSTRVPSGSTSSLPNWEKLTGSSLISRSANRGSSVAGAARSGSSATTMGAPSSGRADR